MTDKWKHGGNVYEVRRNQGLDSKQILDFSANINPLGVPESLKRELVAAIEDIIHYPDPDYYELKSNISQYVSLNRDYIQVGNGAIELLYMLVEYLSPQNASVIAPGFIEYERSLKRYNANINWINLKEENDYKLSIEEVFNNISNETDLVILCNPNNPTGHLIKKEEIISMIEICKNNNCSILIDESFIDFVGSEESVIEYIESYDKLYILRSMTKFFAIPGLRLGFLLTSNKGIHKWCDSFRTPWMINHLANVAGISVLKNMDYINKTIKLIPELRLELSEALKNNKKLKIYNGFANYIFIRVEEQNVDLKKELLKYGVMIRSCSNYRGLDDRYYRIAVKGNKENMYLVDKINEILG